LRKKRMSVSGSRPTCIQAYLSTHHSTVILSQVTTDLWYLLTLGSDLCTLLLPVLQLVEVKGFARVRSKKKKWVRNLDVYLDSN
jgi:hypothetical protein